MDRKEEYREKLEAQFREWKAKIESLEARGAKFGSEAKAELMKEIEELRQKKGVVKERWNELQRVSGDSWEIMKEGVEKSATELKGALDRVFSRFK